MIPASRAAKLKAADWLDALECEGGTDTWAGLSKALNLVGRGTEDENYSRGADTIYFMSDGEPSKGDIKDKDQIVAAIERISKVRHVKVHVVQIGTSPLAFMKRLAAVTGGDYKFFNAKGTAR
jgi:Mg-chelatase subunit ChlD